MKEIVKVLLQEGIDEEVIHEVLAVIEEKYEMISELKAPTPQLAQQVVDRKVEQLKKSADDMKQAEAVHHNFKSLDVGAGVPSGMENKVTYHASQDHKRAIQKGINLNNGAGRVAAAGKKHGANIENLKYSGIGHHKELQRQVDSRHNIKHMNDQ